MKIKSTLIAFCLTLSLGAQASALSSSSAVTTGAILTGLVLEKVNPEARQSFEASFHLGTLASVGITAAVSLVILDGIDFLSSNKKTQRLDQVLNELREHEELSDKSDEELSMIIVALGEEL